MIRNIKQTTIYQTSSVNIMLQIYNKNIQYNKMKSVSVCVSPISPGWKEKLISLHFWQLQHVRILSYALKLSQKLTYCRKESIKSKEINMHFFLLGFINLCFLLFLTYIVLSFTILSISPFFPHYPHILCCWIFSACSVYDFYSFPKHFGFNLTAWNLLINTYFIVRLL